MNIHYAMPDVYGTCLQQPMRSVEINGYIDGKHKKRISEMMKTVKVEGEKNKHKVLLYALSTCGWCRLTKQFLRDNKVEHEYVDVDLCDDEDREKIRKDILNRGGSLSYPTIIVDDKVLITGFRKDKLKEALGI